MGLFGARELDQRGDFAVKHALDQLQFLGGLFGHGLCPFDAGLIFGQPRGQKRALRRRNGGHAGVQIRWQVKIGLACHLGLKPQAADFKRRDLVVQFIHGGLILGAVKPGENLAILDNIAFGNVQFGQNAAFKVLNDLRS